MKKFVSDNIMWIVLVALALGAFAVYKITKKEETPSETTTEE